MGKNLLTVLPQTAPLATMAPALKSSCPPGVSLLPIFSLLSDKANIDSTTTYSAATFGLIYSFFINPIFVVIPLICHFSGKPSTTRLNESTANYVILNASEESLHSCNKILRCAQYDKIDIPDA